MAEAKMSDMGYSFKRVLSSLLITDETPLGDIDCSNLVFSTEFKFVSGSLEVWLDGSKLTPVLDFIELPDRQSFQIITDAGDRNRLNSAPKTSEELLVNYIKSFT